MNDEMKDILLVALGGAALFGVIYLACFLTEKYQKWRRKKDDEEYEVWREKRRKAREEREAARAAESAKRQNKAGTHPNKATTDQGGAKDDDVSARERSEASRTRLALAYEYAGRAQAAYRDGTGLVEAYFYAQLAKMNGHRQITSLISQIRVTWRQVGYPTEKGLLHDDFGEDESAMGRACLRIDSRYEAELGVQRLRELMDEGHEMARDLLNERVKL